MARSPTSPDMPRSRGAAGFTLLVVLGLMLVVTAIAVGQMTSAQHTQGIQVRAKDDVRARAIAERCMEAVTGYVESFIRQYPTTADDFDLLLDPADGGTDYLPPASFPGLTSGGSATLSYVPATANALNAHRYFAIPPPPGAGSNEAGACLIRFDDNSDERKSGLFATTEAGEGPDSDGGVEVTNKDRDRTILITVIGLFPVTDQTTAYAKARGRATLKRLRSAPVITGQAGVQAGGDVVLGNNSKICGLGGITADFISVGSQSCICGTINAETTSVATDCSGCNPCVASAGDDAGPGDRDKPSVLDGGDLPVPNANAINMREGWGRLDEGEVDLSTGSCKLYFRDSASASYGSYVSITGGTTTTDYVVTNVATTPPPASTSVTIIDTNRVLTDTSWNVSSGTKVRFNPGGGANGLPGSTTDAYLKNVGNVKIAGTNYQGYEVYLAWPTTSSAQTLNNCPTKDKGNTTNCPSITIVPQTYGDTVWTTTPAVPTGTAVTIVGSAAPPGYDLTTSYSTVQQTTATESKLTSSSSVVNLSNTSWSCTSQAACSITLRSTTTAASVGNRTQVFLWDRDDNEPATTLGTLYPGKVSGITTGTTCETNTDGTTVPLPCKWTQDGTSGDVTAITCTGSGESPCWKLIASLDTLSESWGGKPESADSTNFFARSGDIPHLSSGTWNSYCCSGLSCSDTSLSTANNSDDPYVQLDRAAQEFTIKNLYGDRFPRNVVLAFEVGSGWRINLDYGSYNSSKPVNATILTNGAVTHVEGKQCCSTCTCVSSNGTTDHLASIGTQGSENCNPGTSASVQYIAGTAPSVNPNNADGYAVKAEGECVLGGPGVLVGRVQCSRISSPNDICHVGDLVATERIGTFPSKSLCEPEACCEATKSVCIKGSGEITGNVIAGGSVCVNSNLNLSGSIQTGEHFGVKNTGYFNGFVKAEDDICSKNGMTLNFSPGSSGVADPPVPQSMWFESQW